MKFLLSMVLIAALSLAVTWYFPWWTLAIVAFGIGCWIQQSGGRSFLSGFLGISLLWLLYGLAADIRNDHILSARMAALFGLPGSWLYLLVAAVVGGLVGGMASWSGRLFRKALGVAEDHKG